MAIRSWCCRDGAAGFGRGLIPGTAEATHGYEPQCGKLPPLTSGDTAMAGDKGHLRVGQSGVELRLGVLL
jgi:hypothetical protein